MECTSIAVDKLNNLVYHLVKYDPNIGNYLTYYEVIKKTIHLRFKLKAEAKELSNDMYNYRKTIKFILHNTEVLESNKIIEIINSYVDNAKYLQLLISNTLKDYEEKKDNLLKKISSLDKGIEYSEQFDYNNSDLHTIKKNSYDELNELSSNTADLVSKSNVLSESISVNVQTLYQIEKILNKCNRKY